MNMVNAKATTKKIDGKVGILPNWDLTDLYKSIKDSKIVTDLEFCEREVKAFLAEYKGKIVDLSGNDLYQTIKRYENFAEIFGKLSTFAYLNYVTAMDDQKNAAFYQNINEKINEISSNFVFFDLEINAIKDMDLEKKYTESKELENYSPYIRDARRFRKYQLSEDLEKLFLEKSTTSRDAWSRLFDETVTDLEFPFDGEILNSSEIFDLLSSKDRDVRMRTGKIIGEVLGKNIKIFAYITNILAKDKEISDKYRGYETPISSRNLANFIEDEVVESLVSSVKKNYGNISHRYYKIKAGILGLKKLHYTDRNAPIPLKNEEKIPWNEAKNLVLKSYSDFSMKMSEIGRKFFDNGWIDAKVNDGKDSGAFSHPCIPSVHPYIMMNYQGKSRDVMTLAHELGHGIHQFMAAKQGYLISGTPLTIAETASVFGEQIVFDNMFKNATNKEQKISLLVGKIDDMINTVIRQIAFFEFEKQVHYARRNGEIAIEEICKIWINVQKETFGDAIEIDDEYKYYWSYIPHFIHSPFYVYAYAFGNCLVNSLYEIYKSSKVKDFEQKYIAFLESGGRYGYDELLAEFGLNAKSGDFWQNGLNMVIDYIDQLENLIK